MTDADPLVLINAIEVPAGEDDAFLASRERAREFLQRRRGSVGTRLAREA